MFGGSFPFEKEKKENLIMHVLAVVSWCAVLNAFVIPPVGYNPSKKYPVLLYVYGGPGSQTVMNSFRGIGFEEYMASQGVAVVSVDGSGTGARSPFSTVFFFYSCTVPVLSSPCEDKKGIFPVMHTGDKSL